MPIKGQLNMTKSMGGDAFMPMATMKSLPMIWKENLKVADWSMVVSQFVTGG